MYRSEWQCRGWGFTLKGNEDFKLSKFNSNAPWDNFTPEYGPSNTGDITLNENLISFRKKVVSVSNGCHIVMADGGFDCFPNYNSQELLSRQLILCQFVCALGILKQNGIFVCKLFDCFHPFTASILYVACMCFDEVALIKPNQSRPANSERYIICKGFKFGDGYNVYNKQAHTVNEPHFIVKHLLDINMIINQQKRDKQEVDRLRKRLDLLREQNEDKVKAEENEKKTMSNDEETELLKEITEKESRLQEVCPIVPVESMPDSFKTWLRSFNEQNATRQIRHLQRIKKYLEDKTLRVDDQVQIRERAVKYWFHTPDGKKFITLDSQFGCKYVTKYEDYNYQHNNNHNNGYYEQQQPQMRPISSLIEDKELLKRIQFEYNKCTVPYISKREFVDGNSSDFHRYHIRGDWFAIAFEFNEDVNMAPPKWVTLISTGNRSIYECVRDSPHLLCVSKTNDLMRLPADTVVDCIKVSYKSSNVEIYHMFDCWVIGSKPLYKRPFLQRQEFIRVLYQGYSSKYLQFAGAVPALQSLKRIDVCLKAKQKARQSSNAVYLWFIRNKKSAEQNEMKNDKTRDASKYWRPTAMKLWNSNASNHGNHQNHNISFNHLLYNLHHLEDKQMQQRSRQQQQQKRTRK